MHIDLFPLRKAITYQPGHNHSTYFLDSQLPFCAKSSPESFYRLTQSACRMMQQHGFKTIIVYFIGETKEERQQAFITLL